MQISVALVEDDVQALGRFTRAIAAEPSLRYAFAATHAADLLEWFASNPVDVLLVDLGLPDFSGLEVLRRCRALQPDCAMMVITIFGDEANMMAAFEAGACGYLLKDGTEEDLARQVGQLHAGGSPLSPVIARRMLQRLMGRSPNRPPAFDTPRGGLSPREVEILDLVAKGYMYQEIATRLGLSVTTVQTHVRGFYRKLGVHNRTEAVFEARQLGLLR